MKRVGTRMIILVAMLAILQNVMSVAYADSSTIYLQTGQTRQILLGASILTGKLVSGTWSSNNPSVAAITSQSASYCYVNGMSSGSATITCKYKYYIGGTYVTSYWSCYVEVESSGSGGGGGSSGYRTLHCTTPSITWDLAKSSSPKYLDFYVSDYRSNLYLSIDTRDGCPTLVAYNPDDYTDWNNHPVFFNMECKLYPAKTGTESIVFWIVTRKIVNDYPRYYGTAWGTATVNVEITCSHKFGEGVTIQESSELQNEIKEYTCSVCNEKEVFGGWDLILPTDLHIIKERAFEGVSVSSVFISDSCTSIGAYTFKDCKELQKIRLPKDCSIDPHAFDGCESVYVYAPTGGTTMDYCKGHANCKFVAE